MSRPDRGKFVRANWPWLAPAGIGFIIWWGLSGNIVALAAGISMLVWIGWHLFDTKS